MSDYLTSLVQRARGETGAVRPIVQPVFASMRADLPSMPAGTMTGLTESEAPAPAPRARGAARPTEAGRVPAPPPLPPEQSTLNDPQTPLPLAGPAANRISPTPPPPTPAGPQQEAALQDAVKRPMSANSTQSVAQTDSLIRPQVAPSPLPIGQSQAPAVAPLPVPEARTAMPSIDQPMQQGTGELSVRSAALAAPAAPIRETPRPVAQVAAGKPASARPISEQIIPVPRQPERAATRPAAPAGRATTATQAPAPPAPPPIRISIGRIEVRAVLLAPPPPPAPVAAPAAPLVTLDAYLRERTGRRDR
jgi:translation initiation factor IF-2